VDEIAQHELVARIDEMIEAVRELTRRGEAIVAAHEQAAQDRASGRTSRPAVEPRR